jgi:hypothetical protein
VACGTGSACCVFRGRSRRAGPEGGPSGKASHDRERVSWCLRSPHDPRVNIRGEPIVNTPADAVRCFLGTQIDLLVLHNVVLEKRPEVAAALARERGRHHGTGRVVDGRIDAA